MAETPTTLRAALKTLGIEPAPDLTQVIQVAAGIHEHLVEAELDPVSRTELVFAGLTASARARELLTEHGLEVWKYAQFLPGEEPITDRTFEDIAIAQYTFTALQDYAARWPGRSLDAIGLVAAILRTADFHVMKNLLSAGLNLQAAAERFTAELSAASSRQWSSESLFPIDVLGDFTMSESCSLLVADAISLVKEVPDARSVITTSLLLCSTLKFQHFGGTAFELFNRVVFEGINADHVRSRIDEWLAWYSGLAGPATGVWVTTEILGAFPAAQNLGRRVSPGFDGTVHSRHLLAVLIGLELPAGARELLRWVDVPRAELISAFLAFVETNTKDDISAWHEHFGSETKKPAGTTTPPPTLTPLAPLLRAGRMLATVNIEGFEGDDHLQFRRDVESFAMLIAANDLKTPLSIGLFGDWGSGKTFFMKKLRKEIEWLSAEAAKLEPTPFKKRIVHIEFNAWHYVEANLWASLVDHIFRNLAVTGEGEGAGEQRRKELIEQLDSNIKKRQEAEEEVRQKEKARDEAAHAVEQKALEAESAASRLRYLAETKPWEAVKLDGEEQRLVASALGALGINRLIDSANDAREVIAEMGALANRTKVIWSSIWNAPDARRRIAFMAIVLAAPPLIALLIRIVLPNLGGVAGLGAVATFIGGAVAWLDKQRPVIRGVLDKIDAARNAVDKKLENAEEKRKQDLAKLETKKEQAEAALGTAKGRLHAAEDQVRDAELQLAELEPDRQLARFISDRAASDDYRKLLGVLAMVRSDFEKLSKLLRGQVAGSAFGIDRIVLYIDDLDRCPPARVVEVLQAVHLLLAYELFVVVVGVDARWVSRSLETRHHALWRTSGRRKNDRGEGRNLPGFGATPDDYLEKIFQVPFWIKPMNNASTTELLRGIVDIQPDVPPQPVVANAGTQLPPPAQTQISAQVVTTTATTTTSTTTKSTPAQASSQPAALTFDDKMKPERLLLDKKELQAMESLATLIRRSPRTVKRFVNVYRLVRAGLPAAEFDAFLDDATGAGRYERVLLLLGIVAGTPSISLEILDQMQTAGDGEPFTKFVASLKTPPIPSSDSAEALEWKRASMVLSEFAKGRGKDAVMSDFKSDIERISRYSFRLGRS